MHETPECYTVPAKIQVCNINVFISGSNSIEFRNNLDVYPKKLNNIFIKFRPTVFLVSFFNKPKCFIINKLHFILRFDIKTIKIGSFVETGSLNPTQLNERQPVKITTIWATISGKVVERPCIKYVRESNDFMSG